MRTYIYPLPDGYDQATAADALGVDPQALSVQGDELHIDAPDFTKSPNEVAGCCLTGAAKRRAQQRPRVAGGLRQVLGLLLKERAGEQLTADEQEFLEVAKEMLT